MTSILITLSSLNELCSQDLFTPNKADRNNIIKDKAVNRLSYPKDFLLFDLHIGPLRENLFSIIDNSAKRNTIISIPNAAGQMERFEVWEASNFVAELQAKYPEIRAYSGKGITDPAASLKLSISPQGIQTMVFRADNLTEFIEPYSKDHGTYAVFRSQRNKGSLPWTCSTQDQRTFNDLKFSLPGSNVIESNTGELRTMRLAQSCNAEYSNYFGAFNIAQIGLVYAAYNATLTRCNGCYEKDLAIHLNLISNTFEDQLIFFNPATDPYSANISQWNLQLQQLLTSVVGNANYDIGHMFGASGGGGNAGCIGCVCEDPSNPTDLAKGSGITSPADGIPEGDNFDIDYVTHEVGHQLGANHTFSFNLEGTGVNKEVGSGITIMGYAGITPQDAAPHSIDIFHQASIAQIQANMATRTCPVTTNISTNNATPIVAPVPNAMIPVRTPFALTGSATDANAGDVLTYCWEQNDNSTTTGNSSVASQTKLTGPNWISFSASTSPVRLFPRLSTILAGLEVTPTLGGDPICDVEALSSVGRTLNFRLTVRDNCPYIPISPGPGKIGQTAFTDMTVTVVGTAGPFAVTSPNTNVSWLEGSSQTVTWSVNGTNLAPISCSNVRISLSTDGGNTFPTILIASTSNDGSEIITLPNTPTAMARIKVEAVGNIFFDIGNTNFTIVSASPAISAGSNSLVSETCLPANSAIDPNETVTVSFCVLNTGGSNTSNLVGTLLNTGGVTSASGPQNYGVVVAGGAAVCRNFTFTANGTCGNTIVASIQFQDGANNLGTKTFTLQLGATNPVILLTQNFDAVTAPVIPAGWSTSATGAELPWVTSTTNPSNPPNAAFAPDVNNIGNTELLSPTIAIPAGTMPKTVSFRNMFNMEAGAGTTGYDGMVLEISINGAAYADIISAGGSFINGGYTHIIASGFGSPIAGRPAWSGLSAGTTGSPTYITTTLTLPVTANGQNIRLKWRVATDGSDIAAGAAGVRVDDISVSTSTYVCCVGNSSDLSITKTDGVSTYTPTTSTTYTIVASNAGPSVANAATLTDNFPPGISSVNWIAAYAGGATGPASGSGNINALVNLPVGGTITITAVCSISGTATGNLVNTATIAVPAGNSDPNTSNNSATDNDTQFCGTVSANPPSQTICSGNPISTIFLSGTAGASFNWSRNNTVSVTGIAASGSGDISGILTNTTNAPITVTFTITPMFGSCAGTSTTATVTVGASIAPAGTAGGPVISQTLNVNGSVNFTESVNCNVIAGLNPSGSNPVNGNVTAKVWIESAVPLFGSFPYVARHFEIQPSANPGTSTGTVTLFFTQTEFTAFNTNPGSILDLPLNAGDAMGKANLRVYQFAGTSGDGTGLPYTYSGTPTLIDPIDANIVWDAVKNWWTVTFDVSGFSGFAVGTANTLNFCPNGSYIIPAGNSGATYQWQMDDNVSGYVNISNGANYSGTNTDILSINSLPTNYYGNKYRCLVNGVPSIEYEVKFLLTWLGNSSNNWALPGNWGGCSGLPDLNTDVVIPSGRSLYPTVFTNTQIRSLRSDPGTAVTVNNGIQLEIMGQ